jgi:integrase
VSRREFIALLGGAAAWPLAARAQQGAKVARIGYLVTGSLASPEARAMVDAFRQGLREHGYVEGQSIVIEYRSADGRIEHFPQLANELASLNLDLILAPNTPAARAVQRATRTIPIVVPVMGDPVEDGLVASLARPGGNITGLTFLGPEIVPKRLGLLKQALPNVSRVAALWHPGAFGERTTRDMLQATEAAARTLAIELQLVEVRAADEFDRAFSARPATALMPSSCFRARCFSPSANISPILPPSTGCPRSPKPGNLRNSAASWAMERASLICSAAVPPTWIRSLLNCVRTATDGVVLITIASEWVRVPAHQLSNLKKLRGKLGSLRSGLTEKNKALLRKFDDPRLVASLLELPDRLWRDARRNAGVSKRWFIDLQTALALDILLHVAPRIENLAALSFNEHLHWPQGRGKPALLIIRIEETKNESPLEFELPIALSDRLYAYRNDIAPAVIGRRPDFLFISRTGVRRTLWTIRVAIQRSMLRHLGVRITPHQFRHIAAKIHLDANPGAYELVRQLLGHKDLKTTTKFYAGIDTRRAGRAHAQLVARLRAARPERVRRRPKTPQDPRE